MLDDFERILREIKKEQENEKVQLILDKAREEKKELKSVACHYYNGAINTALDILEMIEKFEEPKKVELPKILISTIEDWKERGTSLQKVLVEEYLSGNSEEIYSDEVYYAIDKYFDDFCFAYVTGKYVVKKEPKWRIKKNGNYLTHFSLNSRDNAERKGIREDSWAPIEKYPNMFIEFDSKEKAEAITVYIGGEIEELESE